jgi:hypothetical protein
MPEQEMPDAWIITSIASAQTAYDKCVAVHGVERVLAPPMLAIVQIRKKMAS